MNANIHTAGECNTACNLNRMGMHMYFIAIVLPPELNKKILLYKQKMFDLYSCRVGLKSPAHITLVPPYWMDEELEAQLISDIDRIPGTVFHVQTAGFSAFRPRTIFVAVAPNDELAVLKKKSDDFFQDRAEYKMKFDTRPFHPHITIATRDLFKKDFHEAWPMFADKPFNEEWTAEGISLLRHNKKNWDVVHTSQFQKS